MGHTEPAERTFMSVKDYSKEFGTLLRNILFSDILERACSCNGRAPTWPSDQDYNNTLWGRGSQSGQYLCEQFKPQEARNAGYATDVPRSPLPARLQGAQTSRRPFKQRRQADHTPWSAPCKKRARLPAPQAALGYGHTGGKASFGQQNGGRVWRKDGHHKERVGYREVSSASFGSVIQGCLGSQVLLLWRFTIFECANTHKWFSVAWKLHNQRPRWAKSDKLLVNWWNCTS